MLFRRLKRYKYIYAIEQFKQYFADEQWIAIGENVFTSPEDYEFKELKNQVIDNGFGLIQVDKTLKPQLIITPARQDTFKNKRAMVDFLPVPEFARKMPAINYQKFLGFLKRPSNATLDNWLRFRHKNTIQILITSLSWLIITTIFIRELSKPTIEYVNERAHYDKMVASQDSYNPEDPFYLVDTLNIQPYDENELPYLKLLDIQRQSEQVTSVTRRGFDIVIGLRDNRQLIVYSCERFYNFDGPKYIVEDGVYYNIDDAIQRIEVLNANGITATALWLGCFSEGGAGFALFFDEIVSTRNDANALYRSYQQKVRAIDQFEKTLRIRTLVPVK